MAPRDPATPALRASDAEREHAADQLREHCAAGRLTPDEFDQRIDAALSARTVGELRALLADLPPLPARPAAPGLDPARERAKARVLHQGGWWTLVVVICVAIWALTGAGSAFWPQWVALAAVIRMAFVAWDQLGPGAAERARLGRGGAAQPERPPRRAR